MMKNSEENEGSGGFEVGKEALEISFTIREIGGLSVLEREMWLVSQM